MFTRFALLSVPFLALGCTSVDSDSVFTSGLYARVSATSDGGGSTVVRTTLFLENPSSLNYIELEGDDTLAAYGPNGVSKTMRQSQFLGMTSYSATFETEDAGSEFIIEFNRTIDDSAPDSRLTLPAPFDILTADGSAFSRATDDIVIDWDSVSADDLDYHLDGNCIESLSSSIEGDPGTLTIPAADLVKRQGDTVVDSCTVTVTITRSRAGTIDENYGYGGDGYARQIRTFTFTTDP